MRLAGLILTLVIGGPVALGTALTVATGFGWQPGLGRVTPGWGGVMEALSLPGIDTSLRLTLVTGIGATVLSLAASIPLSRWLVTREASARWLTPLLAVPHAALAIGLAFLIAPSGWTARLISPWATGWDLPPQIVTVGDPWGLTLILGLMLKEVPFLTLMTLVAAAQKPLAAQMAAGRALGYAPGRAWARIVWPQLYPALRLPVLIVLAFSLSVVDMALILGPSNPPTLAVRILRLYGAPDPAQAVPASALAVLLLAVMAGCAGLWLTGERAIAALGRRAVAAGRRGHARRNWIGGWPAAVGGVLTLGSLGALVLWSLASIWRFPEAVPARLSLQRWAAADWAGPFATSLALAVASTALALMLAVLWLESEDRAGRRLPLGALIVLPLLLPQIGFLQGLTTGFLWLGLPPGAVAVTWAELLFVFPYVMIALAGPWRALDPGLLASAASLGAGPGRRLWRVKLPVLLGPLAAAAAIGVAVSVAQYLAVLLPGAGRVQALATEAVALASGADRRLAAVLALMQAALPWAGFALALALPAWWHRNRKGLRGGLA
ncbi:ABC transporter permease [Thioclava atlantica]|uniref:Binding-protein-dependent transport system inner membrane protein n=1 Tax=Thioclava atlantica TaxID=1317124 RepID=A0A085TVQ5_9RHOB|nr:hypothetical protein [Thioclava atlantica]KFE34802.1 binding-protein-dependent transport system inner membrane protein [Thioclava atlantica]